MLVLRAFRQNDLDTHMLEKLWSRDIYTTMEMYALAEKCARMKEGRLSVPFSGIPRAEGDGCSAAAVMRRGAERVVAGETTPRRRNPRWRGMGRMRRPHAPWCPVRHTGVHDTHECRAMCELSGLRMKYQEPPRGVGLPGSCHGCGQLGHFMRACPARASTGGPIRRTRVIRLKRIYNFLCSMLLLC